MAQGQGVTVQGRQVQQGPKLAGVKMPATFEFLGRIGGFKPYEGKELLTLVLADGDDYGVQGPEENEISGLQCELECDMPEVGFKTLLRAKGRFGVFEIEREVRQDNNNNYYNNRNSRNEKPKTRLYQNFRFVIESLDVVNVAAPVAEVAKPVGKIGV